MGPQTLRACRLRHRNLDGRAARGSTPLRPLRCWMDRREQPCPLPIGGCARSIHVPLGGFAELPLQASDVIALQCRCDADRARGVR